MKYPHQKARKPKTYLVNLITKSEDEEPDLDRAYLAELMLEKGDMINYFPDQLCCSADAVEGDEDDDYDVEEDEMFYAPELEESEARSAYEDDQEFTNSTSYIQFRESVSRKNNESQNRKREQTSDVSPVPSQYRSQVTTSSLTSPTSLVPPSPARSVQSNTMTFSRHVPLMKEINTQSSLKQSYNQQEQPFFTQRVTSNNPSMTYEPPHQKQNEYTASECWRFWT